MKPLGIQFIKFYSSHLSEPQVIRSVLRNVAPALLFQPLLPKDVDLAFFAVGIDYVQPGFFLSILNAVSDDESAAMLSIGDCMGRDRHESVSASTM